MTEPATIAAVRARIRTSRRTLVIARPGDVGVLPIIRLPEPVDFEEIKGYVPPSILLGMHLLVEYGTPLARLLRRTRGPVGLELWAPIEGEEGFPWVRHFYPSTTWRPDPTFLNRLEGTARRPDGEEMLGGWQTVKTLPRRTRRQRIR